MGALRRDVLTTAILIGAAAFLVWLNTIPSAQVPIGVASVVLAIFAWVTPVVRPPAPEDPKLPLLSKIGMSAGLVLFGVAKIWPQYQFLSTAGLFCMIVPQLALILRPNRRGHENSLSRQ